MNLKNIILLLFICMFDNFFFKPALIEGQKINHNNNFNNRNVHYNNINYNNINYNNKNYNNINYNNINSNNYIKKNKKITFSPIVNVKLIPFYHEIIHYPSLWWTPSELMDFRIQSTNEMMELKQKHPYIALSDAQKLLYQPNNISYDENNFSCFN